MQLDSDSGTVIYLQFGPLGSARPNRPLCRKFIYFVIGPDSLIVHRRHTVGHDQDATSCYQAVMVNQARSDSDRRPVRLLLGKFGHISFEAHLVIGTYCSTEQFEASSEHGLKAEDTA